MTTRIPAEKAAALRPSAKSVDRSDSIPVEFDGVSPPTNKARGKKGGEG